MTGVCWDFGYSDENQGQERRAFLPAVLCVISYGFGKGKWHQVHFLNPSALCPRPLPSWGLYLQDHHPSLFPGCGLCWPWKDLPKSYWSPSLRESSSPSPFNLEAPQDLTPTLWLLHIHCAARSHFPTLHTKLLVPLTNDKAGPPGRGFTLQAKNWRWWSMCGFAGTKSTGGCWDWEDLNPGCQGDCILPFTPLIHVSPSPNLPPWESRHPHYLPLSSLHLLHLT